MEVDLFVPLGADVTRIEKRYPDLSRDEDPGGDCDRYWIGQSVDDDERTDDEWLTYDEAVEFCGFCQGAIPDASVLIEGNGGWAQGMISRRDFSGFSATGEEKQIWKETSDRYWAAYQQGQDEAAAPAAESEQK